MDAVNIHIDELVVNALAPLDQDLSNGSPVGAGLLGPVVLDHADLPSWVSPTALGRAVAVAIDDAARGSGGVSSDGATFGGR
jgi:hypothetical protein